MYKFTPGEQVTLLVDVKDNGKAGDNFTLLKENADGSFLAEITDYDLDWKPGDFSRPILVMPNQMFPDVKYPKDYEATYWNGKGRYQSEYGEMAKRLIPPKNEAPTVHGEALRITSRFYHDHFTNGNGNIYLPYFRRMAKQLLACINELVPTDPDPVVLQIATDIGLGHATGQELDQFLDWLVGFIKTNLPRS